MSSCKAIIQTGTNKGKQCKCKVKPDSEYCGRHNKAIFDYIFLKNVDEKTLSVQSINQNIQPITSNDCIKKEVICLKPLSIYQISLLRIYITRFCKYILTIKPVIYNNTHISYDSIKTAFIKSKKYTNDSTNKLRESIIGAIINNKIPNIYYIYSKRWRIYKLKILNCIKEIYSLYSSSLKSEPLTVEPIYKCIHKGGRTSTYDFTIIINDIQFNVEFKFNTDKIEDAPQFVSPMYPSKYLNISYEEYYYDNYMSKIASLCNLPIPERETYLSQVNSIKPKCMEPFKTKYNVSNKNKYYNPINEISRQSINEFIKLSELNILKLSDYLKSTQKNKIYMLYKDGEFKIQNININEFILINYTKTHNSYIAKTQTGRKLKILLRWKNGNGIAYPAFQISLCHK